MSRGQVKKTDTNDTWLVVSTLKGLTRSDSDEDDLRSLAELEEDRALAIDPLANRASSDLEELGGGSECEESSPPLIDPESD